MNKTVFAVKLPADYLERQMYKLIIMVQCDKSYNSYIKRCLWSPVVGTASADGAMEQPLCFFPGEFKQNLYSFRKGKILTAEISLFVKL